MENLTKDELFIIYELLVNKLHFNEVYLKDEKVVDKFYYSFMNHRLSRIISFIEKQLSIDL